MTEAAEVEEQGQLFEFEGNAVEKLSVKLRAAAVKDCVIKDDTVIPALNEVGAFMVRGKATSITHDNKADKEGNRSLTRLVTYEVTDVIELTLLESVRLIRDRG